MLINSISRDLCMYWKCMLCIYDVDNCDYIFYIFILYVSGINRLTWHRIVYRAVSEIVDVISEFFDH